MPNNIGPKNGALWHATLDCSFLRVTPIYQDALFAFIQVRLKEIYGGCVPNVEGKLLEENGMIN